MQQQSEAIMRPFVCVSPFVEPDNPIFYLRVSNTGKTAALKLRLTIDKSYFKYGEHAGENDISTYPAFKQMIDAFPSGAEIVFSLAQASKIFAEGADREILPTSFSVTAEYSFGNKIVKEDNIIDLRPYLKATIPQDAYVRKLKDISKAIENVAQSLKKP
jgi:hypothetical protein